MSLVRLIIASSLIVTLVACADKSSNDQSQTNTHNEHSAQADPHQAHFSNTPNSSNSEKFLADEKLNQYMKTVLLRFDALHEAHSESEVKDTGLQIKTVVQDIFKNCKLEPDADAAVHPILAEILAGATLLESAEKDAGMEKINQALDSYQKTFSHPDWIEKK